MPIISSIFPEEKNFSSQIKVCCVSLDLNWLDFKNKVLNLYYFPNIFKLIPQRIPPVTELKKGLTDMSSESNKDDTFIETKPFLSTLRN